MKENDTNGDSPCPCYKKTCTDCSKGFEKIVDFKNAGLVIYRHLVKPEKVNQISAGSDIDESGFIFHNTKDEDLASRDFLPQIEQWEVKCVRCRQIIKHAIKILQKVSAISKNEVIGICDHCRLKEQPCGECEGAIKMFFETRREAKEIGFAKEREKEWLRNVQSEFKDFILDKKESSKGRLKDYFDKYKNTGKIIPRARSEVRFDQLCRWGHDKSERKLDIGELCHQSGQQDLEKLSPNTIDKSKKQITYNFDDEMDVLDTSSLTSVGRKTRSAVPNIEEPSTWDENKITILCKKDRVSKKGDRFFKEKHPTFTETQGHDYFKDDILPADYHKQYAHDTEKESFFIEQQTHEKLQHDFTFSFPIERKKGGKIKQQKSSSELIGDIYDRVRKKNEEIRRKQEASRLKKVEEEEKKQQVRQEKIKQIGEKHRLEEEKRRLDEEKISYKKERKHGLISNSQILKLGSKKSKTTIKESTGKLKSRSEKSMQGQKSDLTSSKFEQKKSENESEGESKPKTVSKYSKAQSESKTEAKTATKDYKTELKAESKDHESGQKTDSKESETKIKDELKQTKAETKAQSKIIEDESKQAKAETKTESKQPGVELKQPKAESKAELKQAGVESQQAKAKTKPESKRDTGSKSKEAESKNQRNQEQKELKAVLKASKAESKYTKAELKEPKPESKGAKAEPKYSKVINETKAESNEYKAESYADKSANKSDKKKGKKENDNDKKENDNIHTMEINLSKVKMDTDKAKPGNYISIIQKDIKKRSSGEPRVPRRQLEAQLKAAQEERERKARQELKTTKIDMLQNSQDLTILGLVKVKEGGNRTLSQMVTPFQMHLHVNDHKFIKGHSCPLCLNSDLDLEYECRRKRGIEQPEMIAGCKIIHKNAYVEEKEESGVTPILFQYKYDDTKQPPMHSIKENSEENKPTKTSPEEEAKGVIRYALSDRTFIEKGWTMLPTEKVVRKMNVYRMRPAHPEFDWFVRNRSKRLLTYDSGERFAEFDDDGHGRWFYRNQRLALQYYDAEELNAQQRYVIYSNGEPDERGRTRPYTVLAMFDFLGNGVVFDHSGKIRMKYNQTEGVILDKSIGPVSHWQWHTLNDPPVLQQVMIDTHMAYKDPDIIKLTTPVEKQRQPDNEDMLAIEFDNFVKEKSKKLTQKFKPFQIKMKALKINENFSLKVLDQANVYLIYRDGTTNIKLNLGMLLDHKEIVDTDTAELGEVASDMERLPARTDSLAAMQKSVAYAQHFEKTRTKRELILRPPEPSASADQLAAAASRPMRRPLRAARSSTATSSCYKSMKPCNNLYYDNRLF